MAITAGTHLGRYEIRSKIGEGGMGEVYLAQDISELGRTVALKIISAEVAKDKDRLQRFTQEARTVSNLNHPNILTVYEFGQTDSVSFIATEFVDGGTLRQHVSNRRLKLVDVLDVAIQIVGALNAAHEAGVTHRDLKPENIMVRKDHIVKVLDFGLAKLSEPGAAATGSSGSEDATRVQVNTTPGMVMGTVSYMSPEQARGNATDARTDIWSLGVVIYEMLARRVPFTGETVNHTIVSILEKEPLLLENAPAELQRIVRKALTKDVEMRYQSARDLLIDLKNLRRDLDIQGEIERSIIPNREAATGAISESETRFYSTDSARATRSGQAAPTQNQQSSSSLEYAVTQAKSHKLATAIVALALLGVVVTVAYFAFISRRSSGAGQINSIAVLPFENKSGNPDSEYLSDGLTESLIYRLSQLPNLKVSPTSSVLRYKGKEIDPQKVATELGVNAVLSGRIIQRGDNLTISVELVDAANNKLLWGEQYERKMADLLATQREIATTITDKLQLKLSGSQSSGVTKKYTNSNEAYQLYLKGRYNWNKRTVDGIQKAADYYKQAIDKDPSFALAYAGLAEAYVLYSAYSVGLPQDSMPQAKAAALKAIELDGSFAEPHAVLGAYLTGFGWNFDAGERELRKATELNPNYATAYHWLGNILPVLGKNEEAIKAARRAEELDPLSTIISADTAFDLILMHRYDDAVAQAQHTLTIDPNFYYAHYILGRVYNLKGMHAEAVAELRKAVELNPDPIAKAMLAQALATSGQRAEATKLMAELKAESERRYIPGYFLATAYLAIGDRDAALALIEKDVRERGTYMQWITIDPEVDTLRSDPRFVALVEKVKSSKLD